MLLLVLILRLLVLLTLQVAHSRDDLHGFGYAMKI